MPWQRAKLLRELGPATRDLIPLNLGSASMAGYEYNLGPIGGMRLTDHNNEDWSWEVRSYRAKPGTPPLLPEQVETLEGVNRQLLRKARDWRMNGNFARSGIFYALMSALLVVAVLPEVTYDGRYRFYLIAGTFAASILFFVTLIPMMRRREAKGPWKLFQPSSEWALRQAVKRIPLEHLPGEAIRSGTLWNLGLGLRLAHLSVEERETACGLAGEVGEDLAELVEISQNLLSRS